ncbi:MAG: hypothetical protein SXV54_20595 [Chloroflexota bacterium]|nr:hypothetical protein [Chloroflexota bacterium]
MSDGATRPPATRAIKVLTGRQDPLPHLPKPRASGYAGATPVHQGRLAQRHRATLALVSVSVEEALARGDATLVVAGWQQLERARRYVQPWEDRILSTGSTGWRQALQRWAGAPSGVLFCTPALLAGGDKLIGAVTCSVTMVLLEPSARAETALASLWQRCGRLTVVDVPGLGVRTWSKIDVPRFALLDANLE